MNAKIKMIVRTIPKIIPPTNEAPSNFLPPVGAGVVCLIGTFFDASVGAVMVVAVVLVAVGAGTILVGDVLIVVEDCPGGTIVIAFELGDVLIVSLEATETNKQNQ